MELTQEYVKALFDYKDGVLYWKIRPANSVQIGDRAGSLLKHKYGDRWYLYFKGRTTGVARVIFLWHHGYLPEIVDHRDRDQLNDRIENLRAATRSQNCKNKKSMIGSTSKYLGVYFNKLSNRWIATIKFDGKNRHLGCFTNEESAALAYNKMAPIYHGEFANLNIIE